MDRDSFHYPSCFQDPRLLLGHFQGAATASLSTLCQGLTTVTGKNFYIIPNLNLLFVSLKPLLPFLSLQALVNSLSNHFPSVGLQEMLLVM